MNLRHFSLPQLWISPPILLSYDNLQLLLCCCIHQSLISSCSQLIMPISFNPSPISWRFTPLSSALTLALISLQFTAYCHTLIIYAWSRLLAFIFHYLRLAWSIVIMTKFLPPLLCLYLFSAGLSHFSIESAFSCNPWFLYFLTLHVQAATVFIYINFTPPTSTFIQA